MKGAGKLASPLLRRVGSSVVGRLASAGVNRLAETGLAKATGRLLARALEVGNKPIGQLLRGRATSAAEGLAVREAETLAAREVESVALSEVESIAETSAGKELRVASMIDDPAPVMGGSLSEAQQALLTRLDESGGRLTLQTGEITTTDIAALTAERNSEFAVIRTTGGERQLLAMGKMGGGLPDDTARLVIHSHPGQMADDALRAISGDDVNALGLLNQRYSLIVNVEGTVGRFDASGQVKVLKRFLFGGWQKP